MIKQVQNPKNVGKLILGHFSNRYHDLNVFTDEAREVFANTFLPKALEAVWDYAYTGGTRTVDVHVRHLRAKMAGDPETADALETIRGFGYRLRELE